MGLMKLKKSELEKIKPEKLVIGGINKMLRVFIVKLSEELKKSGNVTQIFLGGSFAKGTLIKKEKYDIDLYVRFDWRYDNISEILEKPLKNSVNALKFKYEKIHGSRDYFRVYPNETGFYIEVIPVTKINKPQVARNVTDLSYFHVSYVKRNIRGLEDEVRIAKRFLQAQKVYGAESYVHGFSGYAVECLIIYYKSFEKMLKALIKVKSGERLVIDIKKHYKRKNVFFDMNENKLHSPVILVDPTFKERNVLASLSFESFDKFQKVAFSFLKKPSSSFFVEKSTDVEKMKTEAKKKKGEFLKIIIETDRQEGDIAGTKLKKFSLFIEKELNKYFKIIHREFEYFDKKSADLLLVIKSLKRIERIGPPTKFSGKRKRHFMESHIEAFKKEHEKTYEKSGFLRAEIKIDFTASEFLKDWSKKNKAKMSEMGIVSMGVA